MDRFPINILIRQVNLPEKAVKNTRAASARGPVARDEDFGTVSTGADSD